MAASFDHASIERYWHLNPPRVPNTAVYAPFLQPLLGAEPVGTLDLTARSSAWTAHLTQLGFQVEGLDTPATLTPDTMWGELMHHLEQRAPQSLGVVSIFYGLELFLPQQLLQLGQQLKRVLQPGGLLLLESPHPDNPHIARLDAYLPAAASCMRPERLVWLMEYVGFERVQELTTQAQHHALRLDQVFAPVSPFYSVVAQKKAEPNVLARWGQLFIPRAQPNVHEALEHYQAAQDQGDEQQQQQMQLLQQQLQQLQQENAALWQAVHTQQKYSLYGVWQRRQRLFAKARQPIQRLRQHWQQGQAQRQQQLIQAVQWVHRWPWLRACLRQGLRLVPPLRHRFFAKLDQAQTTQQAQQEAVQRMSAVGVETPLYNGIVTPEQHGLSPEGRRFNRYFSETSANKENKCE